MARMYVIGDSEAGVLFVKTAPLRLAIVPMEKVLEYANAKPGGYAAIKTALGKVAGAARKMMFLADENPDDPAGSDEVADAVGYFVKTGGSVSEAEFCFIAEVADVDWKSRRFRCPPIDQPLQVISKDDGVDPANGQIPETELRDVIPPS